MTKLEKAKKLLAEYCQREFGDATVDYSRIDHIPIAFTTSEDEKHIINCYANLRDCRIETYVDDKLVETVQYTLDEMIESILPYLEFDALTMFDFDECDVDEIIADATGRCSAADGSKAGFIGEKALD
jgi:hypothetical protein